MAEITAYDALIAEAREATAQTELLELPPEFFDLMCRLTDTVEFLNILANRLIRKQLEGMPPVYDAPWNHNNLVPDMAFTRKKLQESDDTP